MTRDPSGDRPLAEVAAVFLRLGTTAFGGPAAHIAMMREEVVTRRAWVKDEEFADLLGAANLIPGPNSTELAIHLGHRRAGAAGLVVAGVCFILPATLIVLAIAHLYVRFGTLPETRAALYGAKPVILAVIAHALVGLSRSLLTRPGESGPGESGPRKIEAVKIAVAVGAVAASLLGVSELLVVFVPGLLLGLGEWRKEPTRRGLLPLLGVTAAIGGFFALSLLISAGGGGNSPPSVAGLFLEFLKVGAVLYGSGYVLLSYLETDLVRRLAWLSPSGLLDAVAVGQFTPGPVFTTATFVGYIVAGVPGAAAATAGIFLPSFLLVAASARVVPALRRAKPTAAFMTGVNVASLGLMAAVLLKLRADVLVDPATAAIGIAAFVTLLRTKLNSAWLVMAGAALGVFLSHWRG